MNRRRLLIGLVAAVVLAVLASWFVYRQIRQVPVVQQQQVPATQIVVAAMPLALGTRLDPHDLRLVPWPGNEPVPGMFTRMQDAVGRALITNVVQNEPILESKLAPREAGAGLPATIPEGMRAVSVAVNEVIGVAGFVQPGTMVDVIAVGSPGGAGGGAETLSKTVLENVKVLAAGQADMIGMCRALICDPFMPKKALEGRLDDIRYCVADNQGCIGRIGMNKTLGCVQRSPYLRHCRAMSCQT